MSDFVLDASLALQWFYEVGNGLVMACRRKRITPSQMDGFIQRLRTLPIDAVEQSTNEILELTVMANSHGLTNYDTAYLHLAKKSRLPLATTDTALRKAASTAGVELLKV